MLATLANCENADALPQRPSAFRKILTRAPEMDAKRTQTATKNYRRPEPACVRLNLIAKDSLAGTRQWRTCRPVTITAKERQSIPKLAASSSRRFWIQVRRCSNDLPETGSSPHSQARRTVLCTAWNAPISFGSKISRRFCRAIRNSPDEGIVKIACGTNTTSILQSSLEDVKTKWMAPKTPQFLSIRCIFPVI